jgi:hypothetical protein
MEFFLRIEHQKVYFFTVVLECWFASEGTDIEYQEHSF